MDLQRSVRSRGLGRESGRAGSRGAGGAGGSGGARGPRLRARLGVALLLSALVGGAHAQSSTAFGIPLGRENPGEKLSGVVVPGTRPMGWTEQGRSEVVARHGIVATSHPLAAQAGLEILQRGGNAIDAAVAASAVLDVVSQNDTGLGGDLFALVWSAREHRLYALAANGWAPQAWSPEFFRKTLGVKKIPELGVNSVVVPGIVDGYDQLLQRFGTLSFAQTLERAARIAEEGWAITERHHWDYQKRLGLLRRDPDARRALLVEGGVPPLYGIVRNAPLASALRLLQREGRDAFYKGAIAEAIVRKIRAGGGAMALADLAEYHARWVEPIQTSYHGYDVVELPPPGQGFATLEQLNILEACAPQLGVELSSLGYDSPLYWHLLIESKKLAYSDLLAFNADPSVAPPPLARLLSKEYAATLCAKLDLAHAANPGVRGNLEGGTANLMTADRWGNMVSVVQSVYSVFGSATVVPEYGLVLHNRGSAFSLEENHPNRVGPRKYPFHTIITGMVMQDGRPLLAFGNMQGSIQAYSHTTHLVNLIDLGMNLQATADAARYTHDQSRRGPGVVRLEPRLRALLGSQLAALGHPIASSDGTVGGFQAILFERDPTLPEPVQPAPVSRSAGEPGALPLLAAPPDCVRRADADPAVNGVYRAASDPRKDGLAVGW